MPYEEIPRPIIPLWLCALCLSLILLGITSRMAVIGLSRYLNQSAENSAISGILDVSESKNIYPNQSTTPFRLYTYTPLQALIVGKLLAPLKHSSVMTRVYLIRLTSFFFMFLSFFIFWKFYFRGNGISMYYFLLALGLSLSEFGNYALSGRNDALALLLEISAGTFFINWITQQKKTLLIPYACFCSLALLARQNSAAMIIGGILYLLANRKYHEFFLASLTFTIFTMFSFLMISHLFPDFWTHSFKTHVGVWRAFYWLHLNSLQFFACYSLFLFLGARNLFRRNESQTIFFLKLVAAISFLISAVLIHRHGAWLNYFFETLIILIFFVSRELLHTATLPQNSKTRILLALAIPFYAILISFVNLTKASKQYRSLAFLEFTEAAKKVQKLAPQGGVSLGAWAQGLGVHLRDWEIIGPEILNGSHYGEANYSNFKWVYEKLNTKINSANPPALLYVNPKCGGTNMAAPLISDPYLMPLMGNYKLSAVIYPWLCLYSRQTSAPTDNSTED